MIPTKCRGTPRRSTCAGSISPTTERTAPSRRCFAGTSWMTPHCGISPRIVHEADLADDRFDVPGAVGLDVICRGLSMVRGDDEVLAVTGPLFDRLYEYRKRALLLGHDPA